MSRELQKRISYYLAYAKDGNRMANSLLREAGEALAATAAPSEPVAQERTARVVESLLSALNGMLTFFGMDEDESSRPTFSAARQAYDHARIVLRDLEPHERQALKFIRQSLHEWAARAVSLGADGVSDVLHAAEVAKRGGELRTADGFIVEWKFPQPSAKPAGVDHGDDSYRRAKPAGAGEAFLEVAASLAESVNSEFSAKHAIPPAATAGFGLTRQDIATPSAPVKAEQGSIMSDPEWIQFAAADEFLLYCDAESFVEIAKAVERKVRASLASATQARKDGQS